MKIKKIPLKEFRRIYSKVPRLCVEVVLLKRGKILLVRRSIQPAKNMWHLPGGTVLKGERLYDTVQRVAHGELGISVRVKKFLGILEYPLFRTLGRQDIALAFLVVQNGKKPIQLDENASAYDFFSVIPRRTIRTQKRFLKKTFGLKTE